MNKDLKQKLLDNPLVQEALKQAKSEDEKKKILAVAEQFLESILDLASSQAK